MQVLVDFFGLIGSLLSTVVDFVVQLFQDLILVIALLVKSLASFPAYISALLPPGYVTALTLCVTIAVILIVIGRSQ